MAIQPVYHPGVEGIPSTSKPIRSRPEPDNATPSAQASPPTAASDSEEVKQAVQAIRQATGPMARNLQFSFSIDDTTGKTIIRVVDTTTQELVRQIPSEELLTIAKALDKMQGLLIKQKA